MCLRIPVKAPEGSIYRTETAIDTLERVKKFSIEWINEGHINGANTHNVSATVSIDKNRIYEFKSFNLNEWEMVGEWMWQYREHYNGLSVLNYDGGSYVQAPFSDISREEYEERIKTLKSLDLTKVIEIDDNVEFSQVSACAGGSCSIE
jgi:ribonucleoside-diphosphate reductase alpha chain